MAATKYNGSLAVTGYIDFVGNGEVRNARFHLLGSAPSTPVQGQFYFDTASGQFRGWSGTAWINFGGLPGDVVGPASSLDSEVALFSGTGGKTIKRSALTATVVKAASGILSAATAGTDYLAPTGSGATLTGVVHDTGNETVAGVKTFSSTPVVPTASFTLDRLVTIATASFLGRNTAGTGAVEVLTTATAKTMLALVKADVGLGNVDNTSDVAKPVSTAQQSALNLKADLAGPALTGTPTAPTAAVNTSTTQIATTAFAVAQIAAAIGANDAMLFKGGIDASTSPNYPAADAGWTYRITVTGRIGGASGRVVEAGDMITAAVDGLAAGTQAAVGASWIIVQSNLEAASETVAGFVQLASTAEAITKTNALKAVTPAGLASFTRRFSATFGNGVATSFTVAHGLGVTPASVDIWLNGSPRVLEMAETTADATNVVLAGWTSPPTLNAYTVEIIG